jgi:hypothetical protein
MATKKELTTVAKELNKVLGLDPAINTGSRVKLADLEGAIKQAIGLIEPGDEFTEATQAIITALSPAPQEDAPEEEAPEEEAPEEEAPEGGDEEEEEDLDEEDLDEEDLDAPEGEESAENGEEGEEEPPLKPVKPVKPDKKEKTVGVIKSIIELIEKSGQKGISKEEILEELIQRFPNRQPTSMKNTINVQVPTRISKERFPLEKTPDDKFRRKK